jgi:cytochrome c peroxidase
MVVAAVGGCWAEEPLYYDAFTAEQWARLQADYKPPGKDDPCAGLGAALRGNCDLIAAFGQQLFFEPRLSGPWLYDPVLSPKLRMLVPAAKTSCATCHDTVKSPWFIDTRPNSAVSMGAAGPTKHNTLSVVNVYAGGREIMTWSGQCEKQPCMTTQNVVHDIAFPKAMRSDKQIVGRAIRTDPSYLQTYRLAFGSAAPLDDASIQTKVELALDAYMRRLSSLDSPFDRFIAGDASALDASAKRGFATFVGKGMCAECHSGPMFTDGMPRVTGVADGSGDKGHADSGAFYTPSLRNVAETAPYMHHGQVKTLADVIEFYRWGGDAGGYVGDKDALMAPLEDLTEEDARDLEAFMRTLTGKPVVTGLRRDTHSTRAPTADRLVCQVPNSANQGLVCNGVCKDVVNDRLNCGECGNVCTTYCMAGMCGP